MAEDEMVVKEDEAVKNKETNHETGEMVRDEMVVKEDKPNEAEETKWGAGKMAGDEMVMKEDEPVINEQADRSKVQKKSIKLSMTRKAMILLVEAAEEITTDEYNNGEN